MNTAAVANNWGPAALIVFGYIVAAFWQNKRIDDLKTWLEAEFRHISEKLDKLDGRVKVLEDARTSGVVGALR
ncbi:MAG: hypothetical protein JO210_09815 [Acidobacteriaceae bacterium]|nr:hypothetical protein [Acidobacteriaceae bacterium]